MTSYLPLVLQGRSLADPVQIEQGLLKVWKRLNFRSPERLAELEDRVRKLEAENKSLQLEWTDLWHKVRRALGRVTKTEALDRTEKSSDLDLFEREDILRRSRGQH